jgi:hypothetical protein
MSAAKAGKSAPERGEHPFLAGLGPAISRQVECSGMPYVCAHRPTASGMSQLPFWVHFAICESANSQLARDSRKASTKSLRRFW